MTWITLELGHTSAPHSSADAERPERHSHAERRNDQRDLKHADHAHGFAQRYTRVLLPPTGWYCAPARDAERHIQPHTYSAMK